MNIRINDFFLSTILLLALLLANAKTVEAMAAKNKGTVRVVFPTTQETQLADGLSTIYNDKEYGFDAFLKNGGASSDAEVVTYLSRTLLAELAGLSFSAEGFGCSTLAVRDQEGNALFGRNFDWQKCNALIVSNNSQNSYASISTVNTDFISGTSTILSRLPDAAKAIVSLYAPLDGFNEKGFSVAVLMISDSAVINQTTNKPDLTTTTAVRLLLDKAATVPEAIALLEQYDMHSSMGLMVHFALSDAQGRSVVVEYVDNTMFVTKTPVVTNFYLATGKKNGIGSTQSHTRFARLLFQLDKTPTMNMDAVRDALDSVSKDNFGEFESTEWSIVYNQTKGEARYYHRENYEDGFVFRFE